MEVTAMKLKPLHTVLAILALTITAGQASAQKTRPATKR
jgi:hypothetical protein